MSSASSIKSNGASASSTTDQPRAGLLYVATATKNLALPPNILHDWYDEHTDIVLNCPGNGGLFLRYANVDGSIGPYEDIAPNYARRFATSNDSSDSSANYDAIAEARWPFLALVKLSDLEWLKSPQFDAMPRVSALLPPAPDGGLGSGFDAFHAALRSYRTLEGGIVDSHRERGRPRWIVGLQTVDAREETFDALDAVFAKGVAGFRCSVRFALERGYLQFEEPGNLPEGLVVYQYDGPEAPSVQVKEGMKVVKHDDWELLKEAGDLSLDL